jgi:hypothetical protein
MAFEAAILRNHPVFHRPYFFFLLAKTATGRRRKAIALRTDAKHGKFGVSLLVIFTKTPRLPHGK